MATYVVAFELRSRKDPHFTTVHQELVYKGTDHDTAVGVAFRNMRMNSALTDLLVGIVNVAELRGPTP